MIDRVAFLTSLIGQPWAPERSCWHVAALVQATLFGRVLPHVELPPDPSWRWMMEAIQTHPDRRRWDEITPPAPGLLPANDGALVAMGRADRPAHIGVWLAPERLVIHCDQVLGTVAQSVPTLRASGWGRVRFYEPISE